MISEVYCIFATSCISFCRYFLLFHYQCCDRAKPSELGMTQVQWTPTHLLLKNGIATFSVDYLSYLSAGSSYLLEFSVS